MAVVITGSSSNPTLTNATINASTNENITANNNTNPAGSVKLYVYYAPVNGSYASDTTLFGGDSNEITVGAGTGQVLGTVQSGAYTSSQGTYDLNTSASAPTLQAPRRHSDDGNNIKINVGSGGGNEE